MRKSMMNNENFQNDQLNNQNFQESVRQPMQSQQMYVCTEIAAAESIPELNAEPQKAN